MRLQGLCRNLSFASGHGFSAPFASRTAVGTVPQLPHN
jgi:hypothetical protein